MDVFTSEGALVETLPKELGMHSAETRVPDVAVLALTLAQERPRCNVQLPVQLATAAIVDNHLLELERLPLEHI